MRIYNKNSESQWLKQMNLYLLYTQHRYAQALKKNQSIRIIPSPTKLSVLPVTNESEYSKNDQIFYSDEILPKNTSIEQHAQLLLSHQKEQQSKETVI